MQYFIEKEPFLVINMLFRRKETQNLKYCTCTHVNSV